MPSFFSSLSSYFSARDSSHVSPSRTSLTRKPDRRAAAAGRIQASTADAFSLPSYYGESDGREGLGLGMPERGYIGRDIIRSESPTSLRAGVAGNAPATAGYAYPPHAVHPPSSDRYEYDTRPMSRRQSQQPLYAQTPAVLRSASGAVRSRPTSQLSTTTSFLAPNGPLIYYPPLNQTWARIKAFLTATVPEMVDTLNYPVAPTVLQELEKAVGCALPPSVRDSYLCVDGQDPSSECREGLFFGLTLFSLEDVLREWTFWRSVDTDPATGANPDVISVQSSIPPGWIRQAYANAGWLPLIGDKCGNYVGVDLDPGSEVGGGGSWGQVIVFGRDFDRKCVLWRGEGEGGWGRWLAGFAEELERGEGWELDGNGRNSNSDGEENGEDEIGYSSYYFDGSKGGGGDSYGTSGGGLRLTGEYRGWGVLEAFWDRSVRRWTELGMGLPEEAIETVNGEGSQHGEQTTMSRTGSVQGLGLGSMRAGDSDSAARVAIPVLNGPDETVTLMPSAGPSGTSTPALLGNESPPLRAAADDIQDPLSDSTNRRSSAGVPRHLVVPFTPRLVMEPPTDPPPHDSAIGSSSNGTFSHGRESLTSQDGLLLPPPTSRDKGKRRAVPGPAPAALDLPTRADIQAAQAVAQAEETGLRGGWVMSMEAARSGLSARVPRRSADKSRGSHELDGGGEAAEMVDIDLEGGQRRAFGKSPRGSAEQVPRLAEHAGPSRALPQVYRKSPDPTPKQAAKALPAEGAPRASTSTTASASPSLSAHSDQNSRDDREESPQDDSVTDEMATISLA